ncbi:MAG: hypothetical protein JNL10_14300 [Verrucomicrobiales bacterium]|nr:hypothetical protein [Verrucomicrobiales bacterium]
MKHRYFLRAFCRIVVAMILLGPFGRLLGAGPDNDAFANRTILSAADEVLPVYLLDATQEPGEPNHAPAPLVSRASVWWEWTAPADGSLWLTPLGGQSLFAVYRGDSPAGLQLEARSQISDGRMPPVSVRAGQTLLIAASIWTEGGGSVLYTPPPASARLRFYPIPPNDRFADRQRVSGTQVTLSGHTFGATREPGEPERPGFSDGPTVWWEWTPPVSGLATFRSVESSGGFLQIYRGSTLQSLEVLPDLVAGFPFPVTAGETLVFSATAYSPQWTGPIEGVVSLSSLRISSPVSGTTLAIPGPVVLTLENLPAGLDYLVVHPGGLSFPAGPTVTIPRMDEGRKQVSVVGVTSNGDLYYSREITVVVQAGSDAFASAPEVPGNPSQLGADFSGATVEAGEPPVPAFTSGGSVWWRWRAPATGRVMAGLGSLPFGSPVAVAEFFTGDAVDRLEPVPQALGPGRLNLNTVFYAEAGMTYLIRLTRSSETPGDWASIQFEFQAQAEGDAFAQPVEFPAGGVERVLPHDFSTVEPGEPGPALPDVGSRWFVFTPPADGEWTVSLESWWSIEAQTSLMVFSGTSLESLVPVGGPGLNLTVPVKRGVPLHLRVAIPNDFPATLTVTLRSRFAAPPSNDAFGAAEVLPVEGGERVGSNDLGTLEPGETPNEAGDRTVWYRFTAPEAGALLVRVASTPESNSQHFVRLRFAQGDSPASLTWPARQVFDQDWGILELAAGESVLVVVGDTVFGVPGPTGFQREHRFEARPPNDDWASAGDLGTERFVSVRGTNWLATLEADEPSLGADAAGRTVWWRWTAPDTGILEVDAGGLPVALFSGAEFANLKAVTPADPLGSFFGRFRMPVTAGTRYSIAVDRRGPGSPPQIVGVPGFDLTLRLGGLQLVEPAADAVILAGTPVTFSVRPAVPSLDGAWASVTYREAVSEFGTVRSTNLETVVTAPFRSAGLLLPAGLHQVQAVATNVQGWVSHSPVVAFRVSPTNDLFTNAVVLEGRRLTNRVTWSGASQEAGEPPGPASLKGTLWYRWTAPATGDLRVTVPAGGNFSLYTGSELKTLKAQPVVGGSGFKFFVQAGTEYRGRLAAPLTGVGVVSSGLLRLELTTSEISEPREDALFAAGADVLVRMNTLEAEGTLARVHFHEGSARLATVSSPPWEFVWPHPSTGRHTVTALPETVGGEIVPVQPRTFRVGPGNDRFTNAVVLTGTSGQEESNTMGATPEISGNTSSDIWFQWTAPADGLLLGRAVGLGGFVQMALYTGTKLETLEEVRNRSDNGGGVGRGEWEVKAGVTYRWLVAQSNADSDGTSFELVWDFQPPTSNDHFAQRVTLEGESGEVRANVTLATLEPGEPGYGFDYPVVASVWWAWTPPRDGVLEISFPDENAPANAVRPMTGSSLSTLRPVEPIGNPPVFQAQPRFYPVTGGVPLSLVYLSPLANRNDLRWTWRLLPLPANDRMADAARLEGASASVTGSTLGASHEAGEPFPSDNLINTVWWVWTAPADGDLLLALRDLRLTHGIAVYRGATPKSDSLLLNGGMGSGTPSPVLLRVSAGETYTILVGSMEMPGQSFTLDLGMRLRPTNDDFAQRQRMEGTEWTVQGANWLSTREFREPLHAGRFGGRSVWYAWRAPADGEAVVTLVGAHSQFTLLAAYEGERVDGLTEVASVEVGDRNAPLRFLARAGREYAFALDGMSGDTSEFRLALQLSSETVVPTLRVFPVGDSGVRLTAAALPPGLWGLEESFNLRDWFPVMNVQTPDPMVTDLPQDPEQPVRFYRVRRQD